jgi:hypothetical protein
MCNRSDYAHLPPSQIVPRLADDSVYLASESTFNRALKAHDQHHRRGRAQAPRPHAPSTSYTATAANQVWSWDITYLPSPVRGQFYYLYLFADTAAARGWVRDLIACNHQHRHSRIHFVTQAARHQGDDKAVLATRHAVYEAAKERRAER